MTNQHYSIWLQNALGTSANISEIFKVFSSAEEIFKADENKLRISGMFTNRQIERLLDKDTDIAYKIMRDCADERAYVVTYDSADYPERLLALDNYPIVLYVKGDITCLKRKLPFAIVGTRKPTEPGSLPATQALSGTLAQSGFTIVSGGALGIDSAAHTAAIVSGGETVAVLGCGFGSNYLLSNEVLRKAISENGALISEYPPYTEARNYFFPIRNRIIAGMSVGVAVMEAAQTSGSLSTAKQAADMGRDIFGLAGAEPTKANMGLYNLLSDGIIPICKPIDVFSEYLPLYPSMLVVNENVNLLSDLKTYSQSIMLEKTDTFKSKRKTKRKLAEHMSKEACKVYSLFGFEPLGINKIAEAALLPMSSVLGALSELEVFGYIELLPNTKYILKQEG